MYSLAALIITGIVALAVGIVLGGLLARSFSSTNQKNRDLNSQLEKSESQLKDYQQEVTDHFAETAKLVNNLTQSYKDVHQHLANNALKLANVDISRQLISNNIDGEETENKIEENDFEPPKDWAPKAPGSQGTLSESYGLHDEGQAEEDGTPPGSETPR